MRTIRDKTLILKCEGCGKDFTEYLSHASRRKYCSIKCHAKYRTDRGSFGAENGMWKGGTTIHSSGYRYVADPDNAFKSLGNYIFEHRYVMENWLRENDPKSEYLTTVEGKLFLNPEIVVHHKNHDKLDNRIENLECMTSGEHASHHHEERRQLKQT